MRSLGIVEKEENQSTNMEAVQNIAEKTTVHGIPYIFQRDLRLLDRFGWTAVVSILFAYGVFSILETYTTWRENQTITTLSAEMINIREENFPAVTVCADGLNLEVTSIIIQTQFQEWLQKSNRRKRQAQTVQEEMKFTKEVYGFDSDEFELKDLVSALSSQNVDKIAANIARKNILKKYKANEKVTIADLLTAASATTTTITTAATTTISTSSTTSATASSSTTVTATTTATVSTGLCCDNMFVTMTSSDCSSYNMSANNHFCNNQDNAIKLCKDRCSGCCECSGGTGVVATNSGNKNVCQSAEMSKRRKRENKEQVTRDADIDVRPVIDFFLNPNLEHQRLEIYNQTIAKLSAVFCKEAMVKMYSSMFELLWYSSLPCFKLPGINDNNILTQCSFHGQRYNCAELFKTIPTDHGMCCAFNSKDAFRESSYSKLLKEMRQKDKVIRQSISDQYVEEDKIYKIRPGKENGLSIVVDQHTESVSFATMFKSYRGFQIFIGEQAEFPVMADRGKIIDTGHVTNIELSGYLLKAKNGIRSIKPSDRNCQFGDESQLELYSEYTYTNCRFECFLERLAKEIKCVPWYMPQIDGFSACDPWEAKRFKRALSRQNATGCDCLPDCVGSAYVAKFSKVPFRECDEMSFNNPLCAQADGRRPHYNTDLKRDNEIIYSLAQRGNYNTYKEDIAVVNIFFTSKEMTAYVKSPRKNWGIFIGNIGEYLGLCLGISFMSMVEILYMMIIQTSRILARHTKKKARDD